MIWTIVIRTNVAWTSVPNILNHHIFVNLGCIPNFSFLGYVEVRKIDVLRVGGWVGCGAYVLGGMVAEPMSWVVHGRE